MSGKRKLKRVARKGDKFSHFDRFDSLLEKRKGRNVEEDEAGLYYRMYRTKNADQRKKLKRKINNQFKGNGHPLGHGPVHHAKTKVIAQRAGKA